MITFVTLSVSLLLGFAGAMATPSARMEDLPSGQVTAEKTHWLTTVPGVRHNSSCRYFKNSKGRMCKEDEGRACKKCGG